MSDQRVIRTSRFGELAVTVTLDPDEVDQAEGTDDRAQWVARLSEPHPRLRHVTAAYAPSAEQAVEGLRAGIERLTGAARGRAQPGGRQL